MYHGLFIPWSCVSGCISPLSYSSHSPALTLPLHGCKSGVYDLYFLVEIYTSVLVWTDVWKSKSLDKNMMCKIFYNAAEDCGHEVTEWKIIHIEVMYWCKHKGHKKTSIYFHILVIWMRCQDLLNVKAALSNNNALTHTLKSICWHGKRTRKHYRGWQNCI